MSTDKRILLNTDVRPIHYSIHIKPNLDDFTFKGKEDVCLKINTPTNTIEFNAIDLKITHAHVLYHGHKYEAQSILPNLDKEAIVLTFSKTLLTGHAILHLEFTGEINDNLAGFYRSRYVYNGKQTYLAITQFEPCDARHAFPCWDEPAIKARFSLTITASAELTFLANMPAKSERIKGNKKTVQFEESPIMSTYLVAYCIGHFESIEGVTKEGVKVRVWTVPGKKELGRFALDVGIKALSFFGEYYGIQYPLPKQDMIAVPDFSAGAMENWGLITYRETDLLADDNSSFVAKGRVAEVVAHELAHQWFGNLVTMEWWNALWLNEGFATFMETKCVDHLFPSWNKWTQFLSDHVFSALEVDSRRNSHPIEVEINNARQVDELFDRISYDKGASVIQMIEAALGQEGFRKGLNIYLNRFKYANAKTEDLWEALSEGSGKNVFEIMDTWVKKIGFPVLTVTETDQLGKLKVVQNRFLATGDVKPEENETIWPIFLGVSTQSDPSVNFIQVNTREAIITVNVKAESEWIKLNANQTGLYRVQYSNNLLKKLTENLSSLNERDRTALVSDSFAFAYAGSNHLIEYLSIIPKYSNETSQTVWSDILGDLGIVRNLFPSKALDKFVLKTISEIAKSLGWDPKPGENEATSTLRASILTTLGSCGDTTVIEEAKLRFKKFLVDPLSVPADLQGAIFFLSVFGGGEEEFNQMIKVYKEAVLPAQKISALRNIGSSHDLNLIKKGIDFLISDEVRAQDKVYLLSSLASSGPGREFVWDYLKQNFKTFQEKFSPSLLNSAIKITSSFNTAEKAQDVQTFFENHQIPEAERTIAQTIENIKSNTVFTQRNADELNQFLKPFE